MYFDENNIIDSLNNHLQHDLDMLQFHDMNKATIDAMNENARTETQLLIGQMQSQRAQHDHMIHEMRQMQKGQAAMDMMNDMLISGSSKPTKESLTLAEHAEAILTLVIVIAIGGLIALGLILPRMSFF